MSRTKQKKKFTVVDNLPIAYHYFPDKSKNMSSDTPTIILFYRKNDFHCEISSFIDDLNLPDYAFFTLDFKENDSQSNPDKKSSSISHQVSMFQSFIDHLSEEYHIKQNNIAIISHGERSVIVSAWITDYAPNIRSVVFYYPLFFFKKRDVFLFKFKRVIGKINSTPVQSYPLRNNSLFTAMMSHSMLDDLLYTGKRVIRNAFAYVTPTQFILASTDREGGVAAALTFYANMGNRNKEIFLMPDATSGYHDEIGDDVITEQVKRFLVKKFPQENIIESLFYSHIKGVTLNEYEKLRSPEKNIIKNIYWKINKFALKNIGRLSAGIRLGLETGFDSGASLDYIYENKAGGSNKMGEIIDRYYLNNIGWHCTRVREKHVEELISLAVNKLSQAGKEVKLLDIAAGHGRYIMNTLAKIHPPVRHTLMRDFEQANVQNGNRLIEQKKLSGVATFEQGDAFSPDDLATLPKDRTLSIVSGLYELFSDNELVLTSLSGIADATEEGGFIVYTTKLWNPKMAYMARVLRSHKKDEFWVLRRRTQREIDQLVLKAGFVKVTQRNDPWGMFSVTLAKKIDAINV